MAPILQMLTLLLVLFSSYVQAQNAVLCPAPNGRFVNPNIRKCRSFIRCINGVGVLQRCRRGTIFGGHQCIPGNQITCNRVNANYFDDAFDGPTRNPLGASIITQPGLWNAGVQPVPGLWNLNGQTHNRRSGFSGQLDTGELSNNGLPATGWNDEDGQIKGFNPGFLGAWFDATLQRVDDSDRQQQ